MFNLIRRISHGVIPRPDRPWEDDATSNAPQTKRKRRLSAAERDDVDEFGAGKKKARGGSATSSVADAEATFLTPAPPAAETSEVKEVTEGVKEVALDGKDTEEKPSESAAEDSTVAAEAVPLPEEKSGELDEPSKDASSPAPEAAQDPEDAKITIATDADAPSIPIAEATTVELVEEKPAPAAEEPAAAPPSPKKKATKPRSKKA